MPIVYKICHEAEWRAADEAGHFDGSPVDRADGYIHLSAAEEAPQTAALHFAGAGDLLLIAVDTEKLDDLRWEASRGGVLFPHLYGPLYPDAVVWVKPLPLRPDGGHDFPDLA